MAKEEKDPFDDLHDAEGEEVKKGKKESPAVYGEIGNTVDGKFVPSGNVNISGRPGKEGKPDFLYGTVRVGSGEGAVFHTVFLHPKKDKNGKEIIGGFSKDEQGKGKVYVSVNAGKTKSEKPVYFVEVSSVTGEKEAMKFEKIGSSTLSGNGLLAKEFLADSKADVTLNVLRSLGDPKSLFGDKFLDEVKKGPKVKAPGM